MFKGFEKDILDLTCDWLKEQMYTVQPDPTEEADLWPELANSIFWSQGGKVKKQ